MMKFNRKSTPNNPAQSLKLSDILLYSILVISYGVLFYMAARNLSYSFLWFDDAGQFFISQGLNHDSIPYSPRGSISDVIYNNAHYNLDPGGYGLLLYFWSGISTSVVWLRFLSFLFMCGACVFSTLITQQIFKSGKLSFISGLLVFSLLGDDQFYELRAYGMELCGIIAGIWGILWCQKSFTLKKVIATTCILCFFATSRYTMLVFSWIYTCFLILLLMRNTGPLKKKCLYSSIFIGGMVITTLFIYIFAMHVQNSDLSALYYIQYLPNNRDLAVFIIVVIISIASYKFLNLHAKTLIILFWISNIFFAVLAYFNLLPWNIWGNKGGPFLWFSEYVFFISFAGIILRITKNTVLTSWVCCVFTISFVFLIVFKIGGSGLRYKNDLYSNNIENFLKNYNDTVYVNRFGCPEIRYYFEYGVLKGKAKQLGYPERFKFLNGIPHNFNRPKELEIDREKRKKEFFENMPVGSILLGNYRVSEDSLYKDDFDLIEPYINLKIR